MLLADRRTTYDTMQPDASAPDSAILAASSSSLSSWSYSTNQPRDETGPQWSRELASALVRTLQRTHEIECDGPPASQTPKCGLCDSHLRQRRLLVASAAATVEFYCVNHQPTHTDLVTQRQRRTLIDLGIEEHVRGDPFEEGRTAIRKHFLASAAKMMFTRPTAPRETWPQCGSCGHASPPDSFELSALQRWPQCGCGEDMALDESRSGNNTRCFVDFSCQRCLGRLRRCAPRSRRHPDPPQRTSAQDG